MRHRSGGEGGWKRGQQRASKAETIPGGGVATGERRDPGDRESDVSGHARRRRCPPAVRAINPRANGRAGGRAGGRACGRAGRREATTAAIQGHIPPPPPHVMAEPPWRWRTKRRATPAAQDRPPAGACRAPTSGLSWGRMHARGGWFGRRHVATAAAGSRSHCQRAEGQRAADATALALGGGNLPILSASGCGGCGNRAHTPVARQCVRRWRESG